MPVPEYDLNFESGFEGWEAQATPGGSVDIESNPARCVCICGGAEGTDYARVRRTSGVNIYPGDEFWLYSEIELPIGFYGNLATYLRLLGTDQYGLAVDGKEWRFGLYLRSGLPVLMIDHEGKGYTEFGWLDTPLPVGKHKVAIHAIMDRTNGLAELYLDGVRVVEFHGKTLPNSVTTPEARITRVYGGLDGASSQESKLSVTLYRLGISASNPWSISLPPDPPSDPTDPVDPDCSEWQERLAETQQTLVETTAQLVSQRDITLREKDRADLAESKLSEIHRISG